jgi:hypothetical protein
MVFLNNIRKCSNDISFTCYYIITMDEDIRDDLQDSLEILEADKFKQWKDYSQKVINDIKNVLEKKEEE